MSLAKFTFSIVLLLLILHGWQSASLFCGPLPTREEVLRNVYPGASSKGERVFLTEQQVTEAERASEAEIPSALWARYVMEKEGLPVGRAYVDTHLIRTKRESLLVCLGPDGSVRRIEVTAFQEPPEYRAPDGWLDQFKGRELDHDLRLQRAIRPLTGATLTANSVTAAVRRVLAVDKILEK